MLAADPAGGRPAGRRQAAAPLAAAAPPPADAEAQHRRQYKIDILTSCLTIIVQLLNIKSFRKQAMTLHGKTHTLLVLSAMVLQLLVQLGLPRLYRANRTWVLPLLNMLVLASPSMRQMGVGTALMLERPPRPGRAGAVRDLFAVLACRKVVLNVVQGLNLALPPTAAWAMQGVLIGMTWNVRGTCRTPHMTHPITQQRFAALVRLADIISLPVYTIPGSRHLLRRTAADLLRPEAERHTQVVAECEAGVAFLVLVLGLLMPVLVLIFWWRPRPSSEGIPPASRWQRRMEAVDCWLHARLIGSPAHALLAVWLLIAYAWMVCKLVAGLA